MGIRRHQLPLRVNNGPSATPPGRSAPGGEADEIGGKADVGPRTSAFGVRADSLAYPTECPFVAISGLTPLFNSNRNPAHRDAGGGSDLKHHKQSFKHHFLTARFPWSPRRKPRVGNTLDSSLQAGVPSSSECRPKGDWVTQAHALELYSVRPSIAAATFTASRC